MPRHRKQKNVAKKNFFSFTTKYSLSGEKNILTELPHTVTSWVGGGFCTNLETGIGVSESTTIKGFQPFFVSLTLPYSVIRNEVINLPVTVFNYLSECLNVNICLSYDWLSCYQVYFLTMLLLKMGIRRGGCM